MDISEPWTWNCREVLQAAHATGATLLREAVQGVQQIFPFPRHSLQASPWAAEGAVANSGSLGRVEESIRAVEPGEGLVQTGALLGAWTKPGLQDRRMKPWGLERRFWKARAGVVSHSSSETWHCAWAAHPSYWGAVQAGLEREQAAFPASWD